MDMQCITSMWTILRPKLFSGHLEITLFECLDNMQKVIGIACNLFRVITHQKQNKLGCKFITHIISCTPFKLWIDTIFSTWAIKKTFWVPTIDCFSSLSCLFTSGGFLPSSSLISRSNSFINLKPLRTTFYILRMQVTYFKSKYQILRLHKCTSYLLHSFILSVSSSSWLLCLFASLILSSFWKPFLDAKGKPRQQ